MNPAVQKVEAAFLTTGVTLLDDEKAALETAADGVADEGVNAAVTALEGGLQAHGLAGLAESTLKSELTKAEPTIDLSVNTALNGFIDHIDALLKAKAAALSA